jgi:hypothetical protein
VQEARLSAVAETKYLDSRASGFDREREKQRGDNEGDDQERSAAVEVSPAVIIRVHATSALAAFHEAQIFAAKSRIPPLAASCNEQIIKFPRG